MHIPSFARSQLSAIAALGLLPVIFSGCCCPPAGQRTDDRVHASWAPTPYTIPPSARPGPIKRKTTSVIFTVNPHEHAWGAAKPSRLKQLQQPDPENPLNKTQTVEVYSCFLITGPVGAVNTYNYFLPLETEHIDALQDAIDTHGGQNQQLAELEFENSQLRSQLVGDQTYEVSLLLWVERTPNRFDVIFWQNEVQVQD